MKNNIMLVDGMALLFRGFFATAYRNNFMKTSSGLPTNGVYQFLRYLLDAEKRFQPTHVICCWDVGSETFRTEMFPSYKANRSNPPEELIPQFKLVLEVAECMNMPNISMENYEADDCIGTLAKQFASIHEITILTGDKDLLQLVDEGIKVAIMKKGQGNYDVFTMDNFYEKQKIHPWQIVDYKGLTGDRADNYPGVKGIGDKTALKLLNEHKTIHHLLKNIELLSPTMQYRIKDNIEMLYLSRQLAEIKCDIPVSCSLEEAVWKFDNQQVKETFIHLDYKRLANLF